MACRIASESKVTLSNESCLIEGEKPCESHVENDDRQPEALVGATSQGLDLFPVSNDVGSEAVAALASHLIQSGISTRMEHPGLQSQKLLYALRRW